MSYPFFHTTDGIFFRRLDNGDVEMTQRNKAPDSTDDPQTWMIGFVHVIPIGIWASVVASVSEGGETSDRFLAADAFHAGYEVEVLAK